MTWFILRVSLLAASFALGNMISSFTATKISVKQEIKVQRLDKVIPKKGTPQKRYIA